MKTTVNIGPTKNKPRKGWNMVDDIGKEGPCDNKINCERIVHYDEHHDSGVQMHIGPTAQLLQNSQCGRRSQSPTHTAFLVRFIAGSPSEE